MGKVQLSYSTFGLTNLDFLAAIDAVAAAAYAGIEISFHRDQFNPFNVDDDYLDTVRKRLDKAGIDGACVATDSHFLDPLRPHEPSLMDPDLAGRKRRIGLVKRGIHVARRLGIPLVTFGSGFVRAEHVRNPAIDARALLLESIRDCLRDIRADDDLTALARAAPLTRYLHISDARQGYNLKIVNDRDGLDFDLGFASTLVYFPRRADYLLVDANHPLYFSEQPPGATQRRRIATLLQRAGIAQPARRVDYTSLYTGSSPLD